METVKNKFKIISLSSYFKLFIYDLSLTFSGLGFVYFLDTYPPQ